MGDRPTPSNPKQPWTTLGTCKLASRMHLSIWSQGSGSKKDNLSLDPKCFYENMESYQTPCKTPKNTPLGHQLFYLWEFM
jgi:hypothetical protein